MTTTPEIPRRPRLQAPTSWPEYVQNTWTVPRVRQTLIEHALGNLNSSSTLAEALLADDRIGADLNVRVRSVTGLPFRVEPSTTADQRRAKMVAKDLETLWPTILPASTVHQLLRWAILLGCAFGSVSWERTGRDWTPRLEVWHPQSFHFADELRAFRVSTREGVEVVEPGNGTWVSLLPEGSRSWMTGAVRSLAVPYLVRTFARRDWARWSERHGLPILGADVPSRASEPDKTDFLASLRALGTEGVALLPKDENGKGFDVRFLEPGNYTAWDGFKQLLRESDRASALTLLGQASTADEGGSYAKAESLGAIRQDLLEADVRTLDAIRDQVLRPWAQFNYGDPELAPRPVWDATPPADTSTSATTHKTAGESIAVWSEAAAAVGLAVDVEALAKLYGVPLRRAPTPPPALPAPPMPAATGALAAGGAVTFPERVAIAGAVDGDRAMRPTTQALASAIGAATSSEDLRARLVDLVRGTAPDALIDAIERADILARLSGRLDVIEEL